MIQGKLLLVVASGEKWWGEVQDSGTDTYLHTSSVLFEFFLMCIVSIQ